MQWLVWMLVIVGGGAGGFIWGLGSAPHDGVTVILATAAGIAAACVTAGIRWACLVAASGRRARETPSQSNQDDDPWGSNPR